jgi:hypothetical protein
MWKHLQSICASDASPSMSVLVGLPGIEKLIGIQRPGVLIELGTGQHKGKEGPPAVAFGVLLLAGGRRWLRLVLLWGVECSCLLFLLPSLLLVFFSPSSLLLLLLILALANQPAFAFEHYHSLFSIGRSKPTHVHHGWKPQYLLQFLRRRFPFDVLLVFSCSVEKREMRVVKSLGAVFGKEGGREGGRGGTKGQKDPYLCALLPHQCVCIFCRSALTGER